MLLTRGFILCLAPVNLLSNQIQSERDELYSRFVSAIHEVQQKSGFKNLLLEKKLTALADTLEKKVSTCILCERKKVLCPDDYCRKLS